jgi:class 3 adenylate cyclase
VLPAAGLALLLGYPSLDVRWEHHPSHFWLVLLVAVVNATLGLSMTETARRRSDPRIFLVGLAFLAAAGFLGLHALATPGVLLEKGNAGFAIATQVGLVNAAILAVASSLDLGGSFGQAVIRGQNVLRAALVLLLVTWGVVSLASLPPLDDPLAPEEAEGPIRVAALVGVALYALAAVRYRRLYLTTREPLPLAVLTSWVLLAEAMVAVAFGRNWQLSWWEWHVLMGVAFALVALVARSQQRSRRAGGPFASLYLDQTVARANAAYANALGQLVEQRGEAADVARRFGLSGEQAALVEGAATRIRQLDETFRQHVSPQVADHLRRDPGAGALGGEERDVSVLFADLEGFTTYAEGRPPAEVIEMLNGYWGTAVPIVLERHGGLIERFAGDAVMVVFNTHGDQPDHARRASAAALDLQQQTAKLAERNPDWPRLRAGVNTGPAAVGYVGSEAQRSFAVIGDTTNTAARLQAAAQPGEVVIAAATREAIGEDAEVEAMAPVEAKGKRDPVPAFRLVRLSGR